MNIQECYQEMGGNYQDVIGRLGSEAFVEKFARRFLDDKSFQMIKDGKIWATMAQNFYKMGYTAGELAIKHLNGEEVDSVVDSGTVLITDENADTYSFE